MEEQELTIISAEVEKPEPTERRKKLVNSWIRKVRKAKSFHEPAFKTCLLYTSPSPRDS